MNTGVSELWHDLITESKTSDIDQNKTKPKPEINSEI